MTKGTDLGSRESLKVLVLFNWAERLKDGLVIQ